MEVPLLIATLYSLPCKSVCRRTRVSSGGEFCFKMENELRHDASQPNRWMPAAWWKNPVRHRTGWRLRKASSGTITLAGSEVPLVRWKRQKPPEYITSSHGRIFTQQAGDLSTYGKPGGIALGCQMNLFANSWYGSLLPVARRLGSGFWPVG